MGNGAETILTAPKAEDRSGRDRRANDRRAGRRKIDPLFAATLINQITPPEFAQALRYPPRRGPRAGLAIDIRA